VAGVGVGEEAHYHQTLKFENGELKKEKHDWTWHKEDGKLIYLAFLKFVFKSTNSNCIIEAADTDIWMMGILMMGKHWEGVKGTLFVHTTEKKTRGEEKSSLINCNDAAKCIIEDPRLQCIVDRYLRVAFLVAVFITCGRDSSHAT
jgi:hypothetical protein